MKVWRNGDLVEAAGAIDATDRGVLLGDGLFETLAVVNGKPLRLDRHLARLWESAQRLGMKLPYARADIDAAINDVAKSAAVDMGCARITLLRGDGPRGVLPPQNTPGTLLITVTTGVVGAATPMRAIVASSTRRNEFSPASAMKTTNYLDAIIARREAAEAGVDDAIMLNTHGMVAEATAANVFCVIGGDLVTPPVSDGALPGIMREQIMIAEDVIERSLSPDDLSRAEEIVLSNSISVRPVIELDREPVGSRQPGPVALRLAELPLRGA